MKKIFALALLLCLENAFAIDCSGNLYVKVPEDWTEAYATSQNCSGITALTQQKNGWWSVNMKSIGTYVYSDGEEYSCTYGDRYNSFYLTNSNSRTSVKSQIISSDKWNFTYSSAFPKEISCNGGEDLYVYEGEDAKTLTAKQPPNAKFLYVVFAPDMRDWHASIPMISMNGGKTLRQLKVDPYKCGWYYYMWLDEEISDNVMLVKDTDTERTDMIGLDGNWRISDTPDAIPLKSYFDYYATNTLYYVVDESMKESSDFVGEDGFSVEYPDDIEGVCTYTLSTIIYDTDASLHPAFSCYAAGGEGCQMGARGGSRFDATTLVDNCIGVTPGIVEENLDPTVPQSKRKPKLSKLGESCFKSSALFDQLFNYTQGVNEVSCFDMPFARSEDGKWEFNSDYYISPGTTVKGGFYPVETTTDASVLAANPDQTPVPAARTKRVAEEPVWVMSSWEKLDPTEGVPLIDVYCNGPGWPNGVKCGGAPGSGYQTQLFADGEFPSVWDWGSRASYNWSGNSKRNQHFCFESHAKFTYRPGLRFSFRGDDDIWIFIDNKLAVDLGGTHLAAPGYVDLDYFKGLSGRFESGKEYDIDIFYCDRRTTMTNLRIKTNMYIDQRVANTGINVNPIKSPDSKVTTYEMCYSKSGDNSCALALGGEAMQCCGFESISNNCGASVNFTLVAGTTYSPTDATLLERGKVNFGCIDLTGNNLVIDKTPGKCSLPAGSWTLFTTIDDKYMKIETFRSTGKLDVMWADAVAVDENGTEIKGSTHIFESSRMSGDGVDNMIPLYISSFTQEDGSNKLLMHPYDAIGTAYTLNVSPQGLTFYEKKADGSFGIVQANQQRVIGETGIDTLYARVPVSDINSAIQSYTVKAAGGSNAATIKFFLPRITFVDELGENAKEVQGDKANADGSFTERSMGSYYTFYLMALKPADNGTYEPCPECNFPISLGLQSSPSIQLSNEYPHEIKNGVGTVSIRSLKEYRFDKDPTYNDPAKFYIVGTLNAAITTEYNPIYFKEPSVPFPVLADIFDVHGTTGTLLGDVPPSPYYSEEQEYLDGIGDSVAIYYNRQIPKDTLPHAICILWDESSAEVHNPKKEGLATTGISDDDNILCNALVTDLGMDNLSNCNQTYENNAGEKVEGYCDPVIRIGGLKLSDKVKTSGTGKVFSYTKFTEEGKDVMQGFQGSLTDRIAPVVLSATLHHIVDADGKSKGYDSLKVVMSEPTKPTSQNLTSTFDYYMNSIKNSENRYVPFDGAGNYIIESFIDPTIGSSSTHINLLFKTNESYTTPQKGDYLRLGVTGNVSAWSDYSSYRTSDPDGLRTKYSSDAQWNNPTAYDAKDRLPSPWVNISLGGDIVVKSNNIPANGGEDISPDKNSGSNSGNGSGNTSNGGNNDAADDGDNDDDNNENDEDGNKEIYNAPSFRIVMVSPFVFSIYFVDTETAKKRTYEIYDLQGNLKYKTSVTSSMALLPRLQKGTYIVRYNKHSRILKNQ